MIPMVSSLRRTTLKYMPFKRVKFSFSGSFQCRLATDPDPSNATRSDPNNRLRSAGWTYDYGEARFDRIVRFHTPVELRSALIDTFVPVTVTSIEVQPQGLGPLELPFQMVPTDPLLGVQVSLGETAFFDSASGGGASREAIVNCRVSFGSLLTATPTSTPVLAGIVRDSVATSDYFARKPVAIASALATGSIVPPRQNVLAEPSMTPFSAPRNIENYANFYGITEEIIPVPATIDFVPATATGILASLLLGWTFTLKMTFSRFDGDTLTGRVGGDLAGFHSDF
jgi:hypothetical protein